MILYYSDYSPFARKVRMAALHHGLEGEIQLAPTVTADLPPELLKANPLGKIPALQLPTGVSIIDSPVIAEYIDSLGKAAPLVPPNPAERVRIKHLEALADGIMDAAVLLMMESRRPQEKQWEGQVEKQKTVIRRSVPALEQQADFFALPLSVAHLSAAAALDYITHRLRNIGIDEDWLGPVPQLAAWLQHFRQDRLMRETAPKEGW